MALLDFIEKLPEADRESFQKEVSSAIFINSKDEARALIKSNEFLRSTWDTDISHNLANFELKFRQEKLPKILEEEKKKAEKPAWETEIGQLRKELNISKQKERAIKKAIELGIPEDLIDKYIGETDEETDAGLEKIHSSLKPLFEAREKKIREELLGQNQSPKKSDPNIKQMSRADFDALAPDQKMKVVQEKTQII